MISRGVALVAWVASAAVRPIPESNVFEQYCWSGQHPTSLIEIIDKELELDGDGEALIEALVEEYGGNKSDENSTNVGSNDIGSDDLDVGSDDFALETDSNTSSSSEYEAVSGSDLSRTTLEERLI